MEEVIDRTAPNSPEERAIHFLLRHAACRQALTGRVGEDAVQQALAQTRAATPAVPPVAASSRGRAALAPARAATTKVTEDDSCAARFSRAYAAARHKSAPADARWGARSVA